MDEKIIITGEKYNISKIRNIFVTIGIILGVVANFWTDTFYFFRLEYLENYGAEDGIFFAFLTVVVFGLPFILIGLIFYFWMSKVELNVTDKRVYGCAAFGKRVDLPFDSISAVGTGMFKSIAVTTASGAIKFGMVKNRDKIHSEISKLLVERQNKNTVNTQTTIKQEIPQSNADELKKFKELLDSDIITKEEFDAKKKELLGL